MNRYIFILYLLAAYVVNSCTVPFDPGYDDNPVIYIESFPGTAANHVDFKIQPAYTKSNTPMLIPFNPVITYTVNGTTVPVECIDAEIGMYRAQYTSKYGDRMTLSVICEGFTSVYAETTIPESFPERKIDYIQVKGNDVELDNVLFVTLSDINPNLCYGLQICNQTVYEYPSEQMVRVERYAGNLYPGDSEYEGMIPASLDAYDFDIDGHHLWTWEGKSLAAGEGTIMIQPTTYKYGDIDSYNSFFIQDGETLAYDQEGNEIGLVKYKSSNKLILYAMEGEFFKYKVSRTFQNEYEGYGGFVAPSCYCYSNIVNGFGAFAGVSMVETEWITREFIQNNR